MTKKITVFLPCRKSSERVINKNTRSFAGIEGGLIRIKIRQLLEVSDIDGIVISTDDDKVISIANSFKSTKIHIDKRPASLASSSTSTDSLIAYVGNIISESIILWTHATSPFISSEIYKTTISQYKTALQNGYDSLMTVTKLQKFLWNDNGPINYNPDEEKWPRTQTIPPLYEVNSGVFIGDAKLYIEKSNRIGNKPFLCILNAWEAMDIDWEKDFKLAEQMWLYENK